jgi:hypothetical protein
MLKGQLYHHIKVIDAFAESPTRDNLLTLDILGSQIEDIPDIQDMDLKTATRTVKDYFSLGYRTVLHEHHLDFAYEFWMALTSPLRVDLTHEPGSLYQRKLQTWMNEEFSADQYAEIIKEGSLQAEVEDIALYYGLKTIYTLDKLLKPEVDNRMPPTAQEHHAVPEHFSEEPQIIFISEEYFAPLFVNLNAHHIHKTASKEHMLDHVRDALRSFGDIRMILVQDDTDGIVAYLQKYLSNSLLITSIPMDSSDTEGYFDMIVKKTLGVRLVV